MKNIQKISIAILIAIICVLSFTLFTQKPKIQYIANKPNELIDEAKTQAKVIAQSVDAKGFSKTTLQRQNEIIGNGDISKLPISQSVLDSLRLEDFNKDNKLKEASRVNAKLEAKDLRATKVIDSLKRISFLYTDDFATARFTPDSLGGKFDINWRLNLIRHDYKKRKNFLSPYTNYTDIYSPDKRITIDGMQSLAFKEEQPSRFGVGLQAGYYYDPAQRKFIPAVGVGLTYNLIRF